MVALTRSALIFWLVFAGCLAGCYADHQRETSDSGPANDVGSVRTPWTLQQTADPLQPVVELDIGTFDRFVVQHVMPSTDDPWLLRMTSRRFEDSVSAGGARAQISFDLAVGMDIVLRLQSETIEAPGLQAQAQGWLGGFMLHPAGGWRACFRAVPDATVQVTFSCAVAISLTGEGVAGGFAGDGVARLCGVDDMDTGGDVRVGSATRIVHAGADGEACFDMGAFGGYAGSLTIEPRDAHSRLDATLTIHADVMP